MSRRRNCLAGTSAVIPAAGRGERLGHSSPKAWVLLDGAPILAWTMAALESCDSIEEIIVVAGASEIDLAWQAAVRYGFRKLTAVVEGAADRQSSVLNGMARVRPEADVILVHDAARP